MRVSATLQMVVCAALLAAFCELSPLSTVIVVSGVGLTVVGHWYRSRAIGIAGYLLAMAAALAYADISTITSAWAIARAGLLFMLPSSILIWHVLTARSRAETSSKIEWESYALAASFGIIALAVVPILGILIQSTLLDTDAGETTQIMIIAFATAMLSATALGIDRKKMRI